MIYDCPHGEICKTCPCAAEDDVCFPGEQMRQLIDTWRITLQTIANGDDDGRWGRIALAALDKERKP